MAKSDRRIQRTRELLQKALIDLLRDHDYNAITIQEIVDRANVGRTAFYLHYGNKDDLFMRCHEAMVSEFRFAPFHPLSREELLAPDAPVGMIAAYQHLEDARTMLSPVFQGKDSLLILRRILRDRSAQAIEANLRAAFAGVESRIPLDVLSTYLAGAQLELVQWWLEKRHHHTPATLAQSYHRLQRAAVRDAFSIADTESAN
jgi:AcrR family transcriptional regulator